MAVAAPKVRAEILQSVAKWVNETVTDRPFTDLHVTEGEEGFPGPNFSHGLLLVTFCIFDAGTSL